MWYYNDVVFDPAEEFLQSYHGFVYCIEELSTGKKYIGKKFFWKPKTLPVTKARKRKVKTKVQSDWRDYYGSSKELQERVIENGGSNYKREIIRLCGTKGECSYYEAKMQFELDVLFRDDFYNEFIGCKIHSKHLKT